MELTNEQALQQAVEAHKAGKLQDAEALYRAILQTQPKHPDANHNLGVMAVSLNKTEAALPLFKIALEANPSQGQFWLSYVEALIKEKQFDNARNVLEQAKKRGLTGEKVDILEAQLMSILLTPNSELSLKNNPSTTTQQLKKFSTKKEKKKNVSRNLINPNQIKNPPQIEVNNLLEYYQNGQYDFAKNLAKTLTQKYPNHPFGWKVLGALFQQTAKLQDSVIANQKVLEISPNDVEAHSNLGATLQDLGRLEEAEASFSKAIAFKPDLAEAHSNLGNTLKELGKLAKAEASFNKAIAFKPDLAEAHSNLGATLHELGKLEETEASYRKAISLKPDYEAGQYNLGIWYFEQGKYKEAAELLLKSKNYKNSKSYLLKCWYFLNDQPLFYEQLESLASEGIIDAIIGSFGCRAAIKFGIEKANPFCSNPLNYVFKTDLSKKYDFERKFVNPALSILNDTKVQNRSQNLLTNGLQTSGNLFALENILIDEIKKIIELEIENYRLYFKDSKEGLIKNWPDAYSLYGWIIRLKKGGALRPHMHENGWISGSIYINVPPKLNINDGNLVVCIEDDALLSETQDNKKNIIDVTTGSLCLFPASLLHYTIPFESDEDRIVLAFDVIPKSKIKL
jgi:tetratricopeptide (TPR) repeat protein